MRDALIDLNMVPIVCVQQWHLENRWRDIIITRATPVLWRENAVLRQERLQPTVSHCALAAADVWAGGRLMPHHL